MGDYRTVSKNMMRTHLGHLFDDPETIIRQVERSCWNQAIVQTNKGTGVLPALTNSHLIQNYSDWIYNMTEVLENNESLRKRMQSDPNIARSCAQMTMEQLVPEEYAEERESLNVRIEQKVEQKVSTRFVCRKCHHRGSTLLEAQTCGTDEMATISHRCVNCGFVWRG